MKVHELLGVRQVDSKSPTFRWGTLETGNDS